MNAEFQILRDKLWYNVKNFQHKKLLTENPAKEQAIKIALWLCILHSQSLTPLLLQISSYLHVLAVLFTLCAQLSFMLNRWVVSCSRVPWLVKKNNNNLFINIKEANMGLLNSFSFHAVLIKSNSRKLRLVCVNLCTLYCSSLHCLSFEQPTTPHIKYNFIVVTV